MSDIVPTVQVDGAALRAFLVESNRIEGIAGTTDGEIAAAERFLALPALTVEDLNALQQVVAPEKPLRSMPNMNVCVGSYVAPRGGKAVAIRLANILGDISSGFDVDPWVAHINYESLHPYMDGNGRTGRMVWAWHMRCIGCDPFHLGFLHTFYYQTLRHQHG